MVSSSRRREFIDGAEPAAVDDVDADEDEANQLARDVLLPRGAYEAFVEAADFSRAAIRSFVHQRRIAPGIVVGRLQRDDDVPPSKLRDLKKSIQLPTDTAEN